MNIVVCVASGPSLKIDDYADVHYCRGRARVMVVNDNYRIAPWADWLYAADYDWWLSTPNGGDRPNHNASFFNFAGERWTCDEAAADDFGLDWIRHTVAPTPGCVWGSNSGIEAILLAQMIAKPERIILLGYDMGATGSGHHFGDHPAFERTHPISGQKYTVNLERTQPRDWAEWRKEFEQISGTEIINCSRHTGIKCFPRAPLAEALR